MFPGNGWVVEEIMKPLLFWRVLLKFHLVAVFVTLALSPVMAIDCPSRTLSFEGEDSGEAKEVSLFSAKSLVFAFLHLKEIGPQMTRALTLKWQRSLEGQSTAITELKAKAPSAVSVFWLELIIMNCFQWCGKDRQCSLWRIEYSELHWGWSSHLFLNHLPWPCFGNTSFFLFRQAVPRWSSQILWKSSRSACKWLGKSPPVPESVLCLSWGTWGSLGFTR